MTRPFEERARPEKAVEINILLVEDEDSDAEVVRRFLSWSRRETYQVTRAENLKSARADLAKQGFDVVLLDLQLPDSDERESFQSIHATAPETPIVVLTGSGEEDVGASLVRNGAQDFLEKGRFDADHLQRAIRYAIERQRLVLELERLRLQAERDREDEILQRIARHETR